MLAELLTDLGHRHSVEEAIEHYAGLSGRRLHRGDRAADRPPLPPDSTSARKEQSVRALARASTRSPARSISSRSLPPDLPKAVASSSSTRWIRSHLDHLGLADAFGDHIYSGREHVERGKPAPDLYLHAADALGVDIARTRHHRGFREVGATGALASGATVIGLAAGKHCLDGHADMLRGARGRACRAQLRRGRATASALDQPSR